MALDIAKNLGSNNFRQNMKYDLKIKREQDLEKLTPRQQRQNTINRKLKDMNKVDRRQKDHSFEASRNQRDLKRRVDWS